MAEVSCHWGFQPALLRRCEQAVVQLPMQPCAHSADAGSSQPMHAWDTGTPTGA